MLTVAECAPTTLSCVVGRLPRRFAQECAQPPEVVGIQVLQLPAQRRHRGRIGVSLLRPVALLSVSWNTALSLVVFPDPEPLFEEGARHEVHLRRPHPTVRRGFGALRR